MLVCIRIHKDYFTFFIECVSFFKGAGAMQQTQNLDNFGGRLNASVVVHSDSEDAQVSLATRERNSRVRSLEDKVINFRKTLTECENSCQGVSNLFDQADSQIKHNTRSYYDTASLAPYFLDRECLL
jgi:hypothetical protein